MVVNFSRAQIDAALASELMRKVVEVLLLDIILVLALSLSLRVVFGPLRQLRDGLFDLATRGSDEVEELPENRRDELGDVIRGFNQIQRRLKSTIAAHPRGRGRGAPLGAARPRRRWTTCAAPRSRCCRPSGWPRWAAWWPASPTKSTRRSASR